MFQGRIAEGGVGMIHIHGFLATQHQDPACVASSVRPDNIPSIETKAMEDRVVTGFETGSIRSLIASVDDYLMNLGIAEEVCRCASCWKQ